MERDDRGGGRARDRARGSSFDRGSHGGARNDSIDRNTHNDRERSRKGSGRASRREEGGKATEALPTVEKLLSTSRSINLSSRETTRAILLENLPNQVTAASIASLLSKAGDIEVRRLLMVLHSC